MAKYRIKPQYQYKSELVTLSVNKEPINLMGKDIKVKRPPRNKRPVIEEVIRGATERDLELEYNAAKGQHRYIEKLEDKKEKGPNNP